MAMMGYTLSLFLIGVKMDLRIMWRTGKRAYVIGVLGLVAPIVVSFSIILLLYPNRGKHKEMASDLTINAVTMPLAHFPVVACLLSDLDLLNSELGRLSLSSTLTGELVSISVIMLITLATTGARKGLSQVIIQSVSTVGFVLTGVFVMRPFMKWIIKRTPKGRPVKELYVMAVFLTMLLGAAGTSLAGQFVLLGAFIVGALVPDGPPLGSALVDKFGSFSAGILEPFFVTTSVMRADFSNLSWRSKLSRQHVLLAFTGFSTKIIICLLCGLCNNMAIDDALALGFIMCSKGIVDLGGFILVKESEGQVLSKDSFAVLIFLSIVAAIIVPLAVKRLYIPSRKYAGYQKRNILHCKINDELRILGCIYRPDNIAAIINLLQICSPTKESPIAAYALHLMKLVGRSHPVFISHDLQRKRSSNRTYSEDVVWAFDRFEHNNRGVISVSVFTAVSPPKSMHEDICTLALDKHASLIVLPFHRKLRIDGSVDSEDQGQRALNTSVLERAPCSVAVLIDRGCLRQSKSTPATLTLISVAAASGSLFSVAMIFIGGHDDREALALTNRMCGGSRITVDVIRLAAAGREDDLDLLDSSALREVEKISGYSQRLSYSEKAVKEGAETALYLKSLMGEYDLVVVGRNYKKDCNQISGLEEWSEIEELGVIGDLLASPDLQCRASVLVVQLQRHWTLKGVEV
ncbi:hypothetical protein Nepgr_013057 [Nepenthes gracilis]|uniref:Cation/H+ exchanger domain-containing protein n=1 Tax=Nepenthes gracilis TaxID=150966 RepID=A0AAD3SIP5_NEPGR|nr:hypothetical protein Nepgr_013057 [Nepenthes gracilis]